MPLPMGTIISGYRIEAVLGSGGMGTVYRAAHPSLPRSDALKILSAELSQNPDFRARFIREADLAATLDHPNIVTVYNRGETEDGQLWIAMQYVPGSDADKEARRGGMAPARAVHIIGEVAKALDHAHRRKLLHRDVKPANFLLAPSDERVLLADFGIARALDDATGLTATGMVLASVAYAAPESLSGQPVDARADIYSLGCSLYRVLSGATPFANSGSWAATAAAHMTQPPPRVTDRNPELPTSIDNVISKAMAKEPDRRFQSAQDLAGAAADALDDITRPVQPSTVTAPWTRPPQPAPTPSLPTRSSPTPSPATRPPQNPPTQPPIPAWQDPATYPSGHFSGAGPPGVFPPTYPPPSGPMPARRRRRGRLAAVLAVVILLIAAAVVTGVVFLSGNDHPYQAQTFTHVHGSTELKTAPHAVAALGPGDGDAVLALGAQPVAIGAPNGTLPSWEQQAATGSPKLLGFPDTAAIAAAKPDVIIMTGDVDDATYNKLNAIAPTITRPQEPASTTWTWQIQLHWIGQILGEEGKAQDLINRTRTQLDDLRSQHGSFQGKTIAAAGYSDTGITLSLIESNVTDYLQGLGFRYEPSLQRSAVYPDPTRPVTNDYEISNLKTDVLIVLRTDKAARGGGYAGLPEQLRTYGGSMVVVDDPNILAALADPGGYLATQFLNSAFVNQLAQQIT
ncbi:MAG: protein kinase [Mycobacteriaceae bacterium]|nr:protein kinase [Mycobacteriaceae bacterium]